MGARCPAAALFPAGLRAALSFLCSFAFVDLGSMQKVALAIQELNGRLFHKRRLYVNSNRRSPKKSPDVAEQPQELPVGPWLLHALGRSVFTLQSLAHFAFCFLLLLSRLSVDKAGARMNLGNFYDL